MVGERLEKKVFQMREQLRNTEFRFITGVTVAVYCAADRTPFSVLPIGSLNDFVGVRVRLDAVQVLLFDCWVGMVRSHGQPSRLVGQVVRCGAGGGVHFAHDLHSDRVGGMNARWHPAQSSCVFTSRSTNAAYSTSVMSFAFQPGH